MEFIKPAWPALFQSVLLGTVFLLVAGRTGGILLYRYFVKDLDLSEGERRIFCIGLGLPVMGLGILGAGLLGMLNRPALFMLLTALAALVFLYPKNGFTFPSPAPLREAIWDKYFWLALAPIVLSWLQTCAPATANDALAYHLTHPLQYILAGRIRWLPYSFESLWPYQTEMFFAFGLLFQGTALANFFHWMFYPLTAIALYFFSRRIAGAQTAKMATLCFVYTPVVFAQSSVAYIDLALAFFVFLAFYPLALHKTGGRQALLSGLVCGGALGTKLLALGAAAPIAFLWAARKGKKGRYFFLFVLGAMATGGAWYFRSFWLTGNPVYPFLNRWLPGYYVPVEAGVGLGKSFLDFLRLPFDLTFRPAAFGGERIGPMFLMFLPSLFLLISGKKRIWAELIFVSVFYTAFVFSQSPQVRFFIPVIPFLAFGVGFALSQILRRAEGFKGLLLALFASVLIFHGAMFVYRFRNDWAWLRGQCDARLYLDRLERTQKASDYLHRQAKPGDKVFNAADPRVFYFYDMNVVTDSPGFRQHLKGENEDIYQYLEEHRYQWIWARADSDPKVLKFVKDYGYRLAHEYFFTEGPARFAYRLYRQ